MSRQGPARTRAPLAPLLATVGPSLPLLALAFAGSIGCSGDPVPTPTKIDESQVDSLKRPVKDHSKKPSSGFSRPDFNTPLKTDGPQISDEAIEKVLTTALAAQKAGDETNAMGQFRSCSNRDTVSVRCEGELGLILAGRKRRRATAMYYLERAAKVNDPKASADLYARMGDKLRRLGSLELSVDAWAYALEREDTAEYHAGRSAPLQSINGRLAEAADELAKARALDDRDQWMIDEGIVRGMLRTPEENEKALALLKGVGERTKDKAIKQRATDTIQTLTQSIEMQKVRKERLEAKLAGAAKPGPKEAPKPAPSPQ